MYRFYWQSGIISQHFTSGADPGELFFKLLRNIPGFRIRRGDDVALFYMRPFGTWHELIRSNRQTKETVH